jgi:hypothetical protein
VMGLRVERAAFLICPVYDVVAIERYTTAFRPLHLRWLHAVVRE